MDKPYSLELLTPAQRELEELANVHMELVGPLSASRITDRIYNALEKLETFPDLGVACKDRLLKAAGYRVLICKNYLCYYRLIGFVVYVYHIVDGRADYPKLLSDLISDESLQSDEQPECGDGSFRGVPMR